MQFKMQDIMNWAWREDKALWALFKLLGSQIHNLDQMQKGQIRNKSSIDWAKINVQTIYRWKDNYVSFPMHFTELDLKFSRRSYDQFITAWEFKRLLWLFNFIYLFCVKFINVLGKSTIDDGGLALCLSMLTLIMVGWWRLLKHPLTNLYLEGCSNVSICIFGILGFF